MLFSKYRKQQGAKQAGIGAYEAHSLWRLTKDRYIVIEHLNLLIRFTHDKDFKFILNKYINSFLDVTKLLEEKMNFYSINGAKPARPSRHTSGNNQAQNDNISSQVLLSFFRIDLTTLLITLMGTYTNDSLRNFFLDMTKTSINRLGNYLKYLKTKGWIEPPPLYPYVPQKVKQKVAANEIFYLWKT